MNEKFFNALKEKCKPFGLTKKALEELTEIGAANIADDASDDDINAAVDSLVPYAKAMQGEITRKISRKPSTQSSTAKGGEDGGEGDSQSGGNDDIVDMIRKMNERLDAVETENKNLKAEKAANERAATIAEKAKTLGIPDYLLKRIAIADDADIDAELTSLKQDLVNNNLMPKGQAHENGSTEQQDIADAEAWAASLPNRE
ncbi:MAG: hypothetical protein NC401_12165 [Ruminococcus sp.]|nr:hypothetical protein [Ruminococcus sp.]